MDELRCNSGKKFGELFAEDGVLEVKCNRPQCGAGAGVVVIHGFDIETGKLLGTERFREPALMERKERNVGAEHDPAAVRSA